MIKIVRKDNGITLIALVITIIIMLILAGISINLTLGPNGILSKAQDAKQNTDIAKDNELRQMAIVEAQMNFENTTYTDSNNITITIPAGFAPTKIEGESTVEEGLVITDSKGNEFVWVPCYYAGVEGNTADNLINDNSVEYEKWCEINYAYNHERVHDDESAYGVGTIEKNQIIKYGGFFVGRYEAGIGTNTMVDLNQSEYTITNETNKLENGNLVIQRGAQPWNMISYNDAKKVSESYIDNGYVKSGLITGLEWDTIMKYAKTKGNVDVEVDSTSWGTFLNSQITLLPKGRYTFDNKSEQIWRIADNTKNFPEDLEENAECICIGTGNNAKSVVKNIYDLAGNVWEWETEYIGGSVAVRGGYSASTSAIMAAFRQALSRTSPYHAVGFRIVLYIQ